MKSPGSTPHGNVIQNNCRKGVAMQGSPTICPYEVDVALIMIFSPVTKSRTRRRYDCLQRSDNLSKLILSASQSASATWNEAANEIMLLATVEFTVFWRKAGTNRRGCRILHG